MSEPTAEPVELTSEQKDIITRVHQNIEMRVTAFEASAAHLAEAFAQALHHKITPKPTHVERAAKIAALVKPK